MNLLKKPNAYNVLMGILSECVSVHALKSELLEEKFCMHNTTYTYKSMHYNTKKFKDPSQPVANGR